MKRLTILTTVILIGVASASFAGDIQIFCEPGHSIYLDDEFMGTSNAKQDGLFLLNVRKGNRTIRVEKEGFVPRLLEVEVSDYPIEVRVGALVPLSPEPEPVAPTPAPIKPAVGIVVITSAPQNCVVEIDGTRNETKNTPTLTLSDLVIGRHTISFSKQGYETISGTFSVLAGRATSVPPWCLFRMARGPSSTSASWRVIVPSSLPPSPSRRRADAEGQRRDRATPRARATLYLRLIRHYVRSWDGSRQAPQGRHMMSPGRELAAGSDLWTTAEKEGW
jgi:hypothetical protein